MKKNLYIPLTNRALIDVSGIDATSFLQGLFTNDVKKASESQAVYAMMLTPQGKFLYDFFIYQHNESILLDCNATKVQEIIAKLGIYKLRSKVVIENVSDEYEVAALIAPLSDIAELKFVFNDPRSNSLPTRAILNKPKGIEELKDKGFEEASVEYYEKLRIGFCIPSDLELADSFPLEYEMDKFNAIDYQKGCYVGQEVTARTHYRGTVRKKPYLVRAEAGAKLSEHIGQEITSDDKKVGVLRSAIENQGIALLREEDLQNSSGDLFVGGVIPLLISKNLS